MDRVISYPGAVPAIEDFLQVQKNSALAIGRAIEATMGPAAVAAGFVASIDGSANLTLGPGSLTVAGVMDTLAFGVLGTDATALTKQGIAAAPTVIALAAFMPPSAGQSVNVLIQAGVADARAGSVVLAYYNTNSPTTPYNGPMGGGAAQPTATACGVTFTLASGAGAATGSQPTPTPTAIPLYVVTLTYGAAPSVVQHFAAPFLAWKLPQLAPGFSRITEIVTSGVFTVPLGVTRLKVRLVGGGGGAGCGTTTQGGGGGGAGGYAEGVLAVTPGQTITATIGAGGSAGVSGGAAAGNGGTTTFGVLSGTGGGGGQNAANFASGGAGGVGSGGAINTLGGYGSDGNGWGFVLAGNGGASTLGGGGRAAATSGIQQSGQAPGSGAGACYGSAGNGGSGAAGVIIVEY